MGTAATTMRVAVDRHGEPAGRAIRVLLAEPAVATVGTLAGEGDGDRLRSVGRLSDWDLLVSDGRPDQALHRATEAGIPLILASRVSTPSPPSIPVLHRCAIDGLARALGVEHDTDQVAFTQSGRPLPVGELVLFPPPVGSLRARRTQDGDLVAPTDRAWAGIAVTDGTTMIGVADHGLFLAGIALAAGVLAFAGSTSPAGVHEPARFPHEYLAAAEEAGLEIAVFNRN